MEVITSTSAEVCGKWGEKKPYGLDAPSRLRQCKLGHSSMGGILITLFLLIFLLPFQASAQHPYGFLDQNTAGDGTLVNLDWQDVWNAQNGGPSLESILGATQFVSTGIVFDDQPGELRFVGGATKDHLELSGWQNEFGSSSDKSDIRQGGAILIDGIIYFFGNRYADAGSTNIGFWFFQDDVNTVDPVDSSSRGSFTGEHETGDILVVAEISNGGAVGTINAYKWVGNGLGSVPQSTKNLDPLTTNVNTLTAVVNASATPTFWPHTAKVGPDNSMPAITFFEGYINVAQLIADGQFVGRPCFSSFIIETRSSFSLTSVLEDFVGGNFNVEPVVNLDPLTICEGDFPAILTAEVTGGLDPISFEWYLDDVLIPGEESISIEINEAGTYKVRAIGTGIGGTGVCPSEPASAVITVEDEPIVDAGDDQDICIVTGDETVQLAGSIGGGASSSTWSTNGDGNFNDANDVNAIYTPGINDLSAGTVTLTLTTDDPEGPCEEGTDTVVINFYEDPTAEAGDDQDICIVTGDETVQLAGSIGGGASSSIWSTNGDGNFNDANDVNAIYTPGINDLSAGTVTLTLTTDDPEGPCEEGTDTVVINFYEDPTADAGDDQDICIVTGNETVQLAGSIGGGASSSTWSTNGDGNFNDANDVNAIYTPGSNDLSAGTVTLTLTTDDPEGPCEEATDTVVINFYEDPTAEAGDDQDICIVTGDETVQLAGSIGGGASSSTWSTNGDGNFNDANDVNAIYTPGSNDLSAGTVTLTLTTDDPEGPCEEATDTVVINFTNDANADAGDDQDICIVTGDETVQLAGSIGGGASSSTWSTNGDGNFNDANDVNAIYTPGSNDLSAGTVTLTLTTDDPEGPCEEATDTVVINFTNDANADAGDDQDICIVTGDETVQLAGSIGGGASSSTWSTNGDGNFNDANDVNAIYTPGSNDLSAGTVTLTLTTDDPEGPCEEGTDTVVINFYEDPTADAGDDQDICIVTGNETVQLAGSIGGGASSSTWSTNGDGNFNDANDVNAIYTPGSNDLSAGTVTLTLTTDDPEGPCEEATDTVVINFYEDPTAEAGDDQDICIVTGDETVQLAGSIGGGASSSTWSTNGDGNFNDANDVNAIYTPGSNDLSAGTVTLTLTTDDPEGPCEEATDTVIINFYEDPTAGMDGSDQFCEGDDSKTSINLFDLLGGTPDGGGTWEETSAISSGLTIGDGNSLDFSSVDSGIYTFKYTVQPQGEGSPCLPDDSTVTITIDPLPVEPNIQVVQADCNPGSQGSAAFSFTDPEITQFFYRYRVQGTLDWSDWAEYLGVVALDQNSYDFEVKYTDDGCVSDPFSVIIDRPQDVVINLPTTITPVACDTGLGILTIDNADVLGPLNYTVFDQANPGVPLTNYDFVKYPPGGFLLPPGSYLITAISDDGCTSGNTLFDLLEPQCITCETAFAKDPNGSQCFDQYSSLIPNDTRWGWTNYYASVGDYSLDLYAGAGQCDISKGTLVGDVQITNNGDGTIDVTFNADANYIMSSVHLYVGCEPLPYKKKGKTYDYTVAPGQYPQNPSGDIGYVTTFTIEDIAVSDGFYVIAHVDICTSENPQVVEDLRLASVPGFFTPRRRFSTMQACANNRLAGKGSTELEKTSKLKIDGIESTAVEAKFRTYPVPFRENLNIGYQFDYTSDVTIQIYNLNGQLLKTYTEKAVNSNSISTMNIDFERRASQIYIVRMITDREVFTKKIISAK